MVVKIHVNLLSCICGTVYCLIIGNHDGAPFQTLPTQNFFLWNTQIFCINFTWKQVRLNNQSFPPLLSYSIAISQIACILQSHRWSRTGNICLYHWYCLLPFIVYVESLFNFYFKHQFQYSIIIQIFIVTSKIKLNIIYYLYSQFT